MKEFQITFRARCAFCPLQAEGCREPPPLDRKNRAVELMRKAREDHEHQATTATEEAK